MGDEENNDTWEEWKKDPSKEGHMLSREDARM